MSVIRDFRLPAAASSVTALREANENENQLTQGGTCRGNPEFPQLSPNGICQPDLLPLRLLDGTKQGQ